MKAEALVGRSVTVAVPATVANLGAGYDVLGLALEMTNELTVQVTGVSTGSRVVSVGAQKLDARLTVRAIERPIERAGEANSTTVAKSSP